MNERMQVRLFAGCGIASVLLQLVGAAIATVGGKTHNLTISSTATHIAHAVAKPAGTAVWIGAYLELLGVGAFLAFAVWASVKLGGGLLGAIGQTAAAGYATLLASSLAVAAALAHRAGHGISVQLATTLVTVTEALYVGTWFMTAFFLLAVGALAVSRAPRSGLPSPPWPQRRSRSKRSASSRYCSRSPGSRSRASPSHAENVCSAASARSRSQRSPSFI